MNMFIHNANCTRNVNSSRQYMVQDIKSSPHMRMYTQYTRLWHASKQSWCELSVQINEEHAGQYLL